MVQTEDAGIPQFALKLDDDFPCGAAYRAIRSPRTNSSSRLKQPFEHSDSESSLESASSAAGEEDGSNQLSLASPACPNGASGADGALTAEQDLAKRAQRRVIDHKRSELEKKQELEKTRQKKLEAEKLKKERTSQLRHRRRAEIYALNALMKQLQQDKIAAFIAQQRERVAASSSNGGDKMVSLQALAQSIGV